jgi:peptide chain release factor 2
MNDLDKKIDELAQTFEEIRASIDISKKKEKLKELEKKSQDPKLWNDQERARSIMQELSDLKHEVEEIESLEKDTATLKDLAEEDGLTKDLEKDVEDIEERIGELKFASFLSDPYDRKNAIVSIHAGQGGTEAMDWSSMLYRMYLRFAERRSWDVETIDISEGEEAGIKSVTFKVKGGFAYGYLKGESGTHRLVRQSPFNADKLRQTSFALVEVLPELEEVDLPDVEIKDDDLEWQFFRASTQGGQNVQKVSTAVRVIHKPTGIAVSSQQERSQEQNRKIALSLLRARLWAAKKKMQEEKKEELKGEYRPASWGNQIRSYVLHPYKMVKDLRTGVETSDTDSVLDGDLDEFVEAEVMLSE